MNKVLRIAHFAQTFCLLVFAQVVLVQKVVAQADACTNAGVVTCGTSLTGQTNVGATNDAFPACNTNGTLATGAPNVWYTFVGTGQAVTVSTCANTSFDSEIGIFSGSCGALVCVAGSDADACGTSDETITFNSVAGTNYFIMVQGHNGATGTFTLDVTCAAPPADPCAAPIETIACASSKSVNLSGAGAGWNVTTCGFNTSGAEKVFSFTPTVTGIHTLQVTATNSTFIDYFFKVASGGCSSAGWTCIDDISVATSTTFGPLTAGTTYLILLDDENTSASTATFQINCPAPPVDPCAAPIETIACAQSKTVTLSGTGGGWNVNSCGFSTPGAEKVFSFTPTVTGNHTLQVTNTDLTFVDYFFKDASGGCSSTGWTCIDDISTASSITFGPLTAGVTYLILLDDESAAASTHTFQINCPAPSCPATITSSSAAMCVNDTRTLTGSPAGGTFSVTSGPGSITAGVLTATGAGTINLLYSYFDPVTSCSSTATQSILVNALPTAGITGTFSACIGSTVTLTGTGGVSYLWGTTETTPSINIVMPGAPSVIGLTVTDANGCSASTAQGLTPLFLPVITIDPDSIIQPTTCVATNGSIGGLSISGVSAPISYSWSTGSTAPRISGLGVGVYTVTVTGGNGCTSSQVVSLIGPGGCDVCPTVGSISASPSPVCAGSNSTLTASGLLNMGNTYGIQFLSFPGPTGDPYTGGTVLATVPNGSLAPGGTSAAASVNFPTAASLFIYAILSPTPIDPSCRPWVGTTLNINSLPTPGITVTETSGTTANDGAICQGASATLTGTGGTAYAWSTGASTAAVTVNTAGTYTVTVTNANGCTATATTTITVNPLPTPAIAVSETSGTTSNDGILCQGFSATLTASGGTSYAWSTSANTAAITVNTAGTYTVTVTNADGCSATATTTITVNPLPTAVTTVAETSGTTANDGIICVGASATITASGGTSYAWSTGASTAAITVNPAATTTYTVTVTNANGCSATATRTITVNPLPTAFALTGGGQRCDTDNQGVPVGLAGSQSGVNYQLQLNGNNVGAPVAGTGNPISFGGQLPAGTYTVIALNTTSGCTASMSGSVTISIISCGVSISDPCVCLNNATTLENGQFGEVITVNAPAGQTWTVTAINGLFSTASAAPPTAPTPINVGTVLSASGTTYTLSGRHIDAIGYTVTVSNGRGTSLSIGNNCSYPNPAITSDLTGPFCLYSDPVTLAGTPGDANFVSATFTVNGVPATTFDPGAGLGQYTIVYRVDGGVPKAAGANDPGCVQTVSQIVNVVATPSALSCNDFVNISLDVDCVTEITPDMILEGTYGCFDDYIVELDKTAPFGNGPWVPAVVGTADLGKTYQARVTHLVSGNKCWGEVKIEDKLAPVLSCQNVDLFCPITTYTPAYITNTLGIAAGTPTVTD
ncbi:MAG: hypothetical protein J0L99_01200, partial [Chitinophagales bacterium]|nr:hypothetical protein [Chitinophagales bacterium]